MAWNSQMGNNEYTTVEQRRKQNLSRLPVSQTPVAPASGSSGGSSAGVATPAAPDGASMYMSALKEMQRAQEAEYARQRAEYEKQQAELKARQNELKAARTGQMNEAFDNSKLNLDGAKESSLKDSYVAYMHGLKNMPQTSAISGNGGYAQSLLNRQQLAYENNRNAIEQNYLDNLRQLEADKNAGLATIEQDYLNGIMGLETNAQNYLNQLAALKNNDNTYSEQMAAIINKASAPAAKTGATATKSGTEEYTYKLGGKSYSAQELITYLKGQGMTQAEIARYMQANGLTL